MGGVPDDSREWLTTQCACLALTHQDERSSAIVDGRAARRCDRSAIFFKRGSQAWDLLNVDFSGTFVDSNKPIARPRLDGNRCNFCRKATVGRCCLGALYRRNRKSILLFTGELVLSGAVFAEGTICSACFLGVF